MLVSPRSTPPPSPSPSPLPSPLPLPCFALSASPRRVQYCRAERTASLPIDTLSAPARKYRDATSSALHVLPSPSVISRIPPPTVSGTKISLDASSSTRSIGWSSSTISRKLVMFKNVISSAPSS